LDFAVAVGTLGGVPLPRRHVRSDAMIPSEPEPPDADPMPQRPPEPDATDCCGEGCVRCVYDVHDEALERYEQALAAWRARRQSSG
jgi:hypothetical protein